MPIHTLVCHRTENACLYTWVTKRAGQSPQHLTALLYNRRDQVVPIIEPMENGTAPKIAAS